MQPPENKIQDEFGQVVEKLKSANNVLVTISTNPTVDQFAAAIGLTLILNKIGKHANAVFSGKVPSTIDFLKPEKTLEKNTDSLRDFIIALDKSKADKLRYKVEDEVVKIFITPYKTSISEKDLDFSQGDFNVDAVVALGVQDKEHIDAAVLAHGRILHDATVISINTSQQSRLGSINWNDARASSLCEMAADIATELDNKVFDSQNATALLTGIVAETDRYSNKKAAPHTMSVAGLLMAAGASTQLVSSKLEEEKAEVLPPLAHQGEGDEKVDGVLEINHPHSEETEEDSIISKLEELKSETEPSEDDNKPRMIHEPPELGGQLTANSVPEEDRYSGSTDPLSNLPDNPLLSKTDTEVSNSAKDEDEAVDDNKTLEQIEQSVDSPHLSQDSTDNNVANDSGESSELDTAPEASLDEARDAVLRAQATLNGEEDRPEARQDMGTTELGHNLGGDTSPPESATLDPANDTNDSPPAPPVPPPLMPTSA